MAVVLALAAVALFLCLAACVVPIYRRAWTAHRLTAGIPGPPAYPLIGHLHLMLTPLDRIQALIDSMCAEHGYLIKGWFGPLMGLVVLDPEDLQVVMTSPHAATKLELMYDTLAPFLGRGLLVLNGRDYKRHRKAITASLHFDILKEFVPAFSATCRELQGQLDRHAEAGDVFEVSHALARNACLTLCRSLLASDPVGLEAELAAFVDALSDDAAGVMLYSSLRPWFRWHALFRLVSPAEYAGQRRFIDAFTAFVRAGLAKKMRETNSPTHRRQTFLDEFLSSPEASVFTPDELLDELKTLLFGGIGTSTDFQSMFLLCMALQPDVQRRVQKELDDVFGSNIDRAIEVVDLPHLEYLECAIKETLRLFPTAPVMARTVTQSIQLPSGHVIPEGTNLCLLPLWTHRNPKYFPDPLKFDPERFNPENRRNRHPYAFIPFSAGVRSCVGQRFGLMFAKTVAASVLRRFDVLPDPDGPQNLQDVPLVGGITLSVKGGVKVRLRRRTKLEVVL